MIANNLHRQQSLYWAKMVDLKVAANYIRSYRDYLGRRATAIGTVRAIASSVSIGAWAIWRQYAFVWGFIIVVSQILDALRDALRDVFPVAKRHKAASEYTVVLESLFIDAQLEWEAIFAGKYENGESPSGFTSCERCTTMPKAEAFRMGYQSRMISFG